MQHPWMNYLNPGTVVVVVGKGRRNSGGGILTHKSFVILFFMGAKDKSNHLTAGSLQRFSRIAETEQPYQVKRMIGGIGTCCSRSFLKLEHGQYPVVTFGEPLKHVITPRGLFLVSRTGDDRRV